MEKMPLLRGFINDRLIAAAEEIFGVVEKTIVENHEEVLRLQRLLDVFLQPVIKLQKTDLQQLTLSEEEVPPEQQQCEQEWSPSLGQEDQQSTQIKEEELQTSQEEEQFQGPESYTEFSTFSPAFEEDPTRPSHLYEALMNESGESEPLSSTTAEQIKTEADGEDYRESEPTSVSQLLSVLNPDCSAAHSGRVGGMEVRGPPSVFKPDYSKRTVMVEEQISITNKTGRNPTGVPPEKSTSHATPSCCKVCGMAFYYMGSLIKHVKTHTKEKKLLCGVCGIFFQSTESMKDHLQTHIVDRFTCPLCSKRFACNSRLMEHMTIHTEEKLYHCPDCDKGFNKISYLKKHTRIHTGEKRYHCPDCDKGFNNSSYLKKHIRIHTGEKPYCCNNCGKTFSRSEPLKVHMRTHTGEKPYQCGDCDKGFCSSGDLRKHIRSHTGEKPYRCGDCGKGFSLNQNLKVHQRTHTGERPYRCGDCGKEYITCRQLKTHVLAHRRDTKLEDRNGVIHLDHLLTEPPMVTGGL
ncbi:zinc finger protein 239-like isoform X1 [Esox lucius]|uniref:zinc finger protein 239-like isoform X1 n=1 Tax=Esox lucius TaxID=8010 RepID=UPI0010BD7F5F|nr:zinc finger protein 239-like isoform X1 [Esox lucius]